MSETKNYHLNLTDDAQTKFLAWRNSINGNTNSNMIKIDVVAADMRISGQVDGAFTVTAYGDKPTRDIPVTIILLG